MSVRFFFYFSFSFILRKHEQIRGKCCVHSLSKTKQKIKNEIENLNTYPKICKTNFLRFEHQLANNLIFFSFCISFQNIKEKCVIFEKWVESRRAVISDDRGLNTRPKHNKSLTKISRTQYLNLNRSNIYNDFETLFLNHKHSTFGAPVSEYKFH